MLTRLADAIDALSALAGRLAGWLAVALVALVGALVLARYAFSAGSVAAQEAVLWLHASVFLLAFAHALREDAHVRVDVWSQRWSGRTRARIELAGTALLLLPLCLFIVLMSWDYVAASWSAREGSRDPGGLPAWYLLKALLPVSAALLALQGLARARRAWGQAFPAAAA